MKTQNKKSALDMRVDILVAVGGIPSWTTFIREEEDSISQRKTIE
jgi:hypothetical protein